MLKRVAQQWDTPIGAYRRRVVGEIGRNRRARLFLEGDAAGHGTNTALGQTLIPLSSDIVLIRP